MRISDWSSDVCSSDLLEVVEADRRIHRRVEEVAHGAAGVGEGGELELGRREEVDPPPGARDRVEDGAERQLRRDGEAVALVAQARAGDRRVDGEHQRVEAGLTRVAPEVVGDLTLAHDVDRTSVVWGKSGAVRVVLGGARYNKKTN